VDFGGFFTKDSGAVGGFRCDDPKDPNKCALGARTIPRLRRDRCSVRHHDEQGAGTSLLWHFTPKNSQEGDED
jgi:hypothetical protein